jgi:tetratricopeptide (TPR) repeat protein
MPDRRGRQPYDPPYGGGRNLPPPSYADPSSSAAWTQIHPGNRRRFRSPINRSNWVKWALGCTGLGMLVCTSLIMLAVIVLPVAFRSLLPEQQAWIIRRLPFMSALRPTQPFSSLPTFGPTSANALALLSTPVSSPTPIPSVAALASGSDETTAVVPAASPTSQLPTQPPTLPPTSVLASDTPVPVEFTATPVIQATLLPQQPSPTLQLPTLQPPTLFPTSIPTLLPTLVPSPTPIPIPSSFHAVGFKWVPQDWNNCGPANLTQALNYTGWPGDQHQAAAYLKPNREDKNVSPWQMVTFVNDKTSFRAVMRYAGDFNLLKVLVSRKFPVLLETGFNVAGEGWMGHYLTIIGYDDYYFYGLDTYLGDEKDNLGIREKYDDLDARWQQFNRVYVVVYAREREPELAALLGSDADQHYNWQRALNVARAEARAQPTNQYAWFNMGTSYTLLGQYKEAAAAFDQASSVGGGLPWRFLWYQFWPFEAYYDVGNYTNVMALVTATLQTTPYVEETFYWRAMVEAAQGKTSQAISDFKRVLTFNPNYTPAIDRLNQVQSGSFMPPVVARAGQ